jgi:hypothetical protein
MAPAEIRALGRVMYTLIFRYRSSWELPNEVIDAYFKANPSVLAEALSWSKIPDVPDVGRVPAELYVECFAQRRGLNAHVLKRWAHAASVEIANDCLPALHQQYDAGLAPAWWDDPSFELAQPLIAARRVAQRGIQADLAAHDALVRRASQTGQLPDLPLGREPDFR